MNALASVVALGFLLGMRHATDADHVAAVATIVSRERSLKVAAWVGALWGLGHTLTLVLVGVPIIAFNWVVAPRLGLAMEFAVGLMLILLGVRNLAATHRHDASLPGPAPVVVGLVHGLAGSAAIALLVLTTIDDVMWGFVYLLLFGAGTVIGMMMVTTAIALPFAGTATRSVRTHLYLRAATGLMSVGFGVFLAYQIGVVQGLFSAAPQWTPK